MSPSRTDIIDARANRKTIRPDRRIAYFTSPWWYMWFRLRLRRCEGRRVEREYFPRYTR